MSDAYLTMWSQPQVEKEREHRAGGTLDHAASAQFRARGIETGDRVYVVATEAGRLLLPGRLTVERITDQMGAEAHFGQPVYDAPDHLLGQGSELRLDREVPEDIARRLERESGRHIAIAPDRYKVDANSLRTTGRITEESAALLDGLLAETVRVETEQGFFEGGRQMRRHLAVERSPALRSAALKAHGTTCQVCGLSFGEVYGSIGEGFAEIHHLVPLSTLDRAMSVDPVADVAVLCANCHRMVHTADPPLTPAALRGHLRE